MVIIPAMLYRLSLALEWLVLSASLPDGLYLQRAAGHG